MTAQNLGVCLAPALIGMDATTLTATDALKKYANATILAKAVEGFIDYAYVSCFVRAQRRNLC